MVEDFSADVELADLLDEVRASEHGASGSRGDNAVLTIAFALTALLVGSLTVMTAFVDEPFRITLLGDEHISLTVWLKTKPGDLSGSAAKTWLASFLLSQLLGVAGAELPGAPRGRRAAGSWSPVLAGSRGIINRRSIFAVSFSKAVKRCSMKEAATFDVQAGSWASKDSSRLPTRCSNACTTVQ